MKIFLRVKEIKLYRNKIYILEKGNTLIKLPCLSVTEKYTNPICTQAY